MKFPPIWIFLLLLTAAGCTKVDYGSVASPAYLRVFNSLNYLITVANKDQPPPYLTMIIDPVYDSVTHAPTGGLVVGDFLDTRLNYAPPAPNNAGSTSPVNNEYPGNAKVLTAPVLNGFDLSSWAEIVSGKHHFAFYSRPRNLTPFFQLPAAARQVVMADTSFSLTQGEIYTMEVLQPDAYNNRSIVYTRQEQFQRQAFADSLLYVNFYNLSAANYVAYNLAGAKVDPNAYNGGQMVRDTVSVYYTLYTGDSLGGFSSNINIPGYKNIYLTSLIRGQQSSVAPYFSIPAFAGIDSTRGILSREWQEFTFLNPAYQLPEQPFGAYDGQGNLVNLYCNSSYYKGFGGAGEPNMIITTASGNYTARSFSTINTVEFVNNRVYLMSIQRVYAPPTRH